MTKARQDGLYLFLLGCLAFLLFGFALEHMLDTGMGDFKAVYYSSLTLVDHHDPYREADLLQTFQSHGGQFSVIPASAAAERRAILLCINMPATLMLIAPFALLPWGPAHILWMSLTAALFILAAYLMWSIGARYSPIFAGGLLGLILLNSELLIFEGNLAGIVISLCVIAVWCFLQNRFVPLGILFLALALITKPQDSGLIWLYFLLAGGIYRKRALQTLLVAAIIALPAVLWVAHVAPGFLHEQFANLASASARGDLNDPGPTSMGAHNLGGMINLQTTLSYIRDNPHFYNPLAWIISAPLFIAWAISTLRTSPTPQTLDPRPQTPDQSPSALDPIPDTPDPRPQTPDPALVPSPQTLLAIAAIAILTLLPVYHRQYDAKLLLLAVPACAFLWSKASQTSRPAARLAALLTTASILITGDLTWAMALGLIHNMHTSAATSSSAQLVTAALVFAIPFTLLSTTAFYTWLYARPPILKP
jgi:hypothetical protein